jgi:DNA mismatch endonuclease (patch repair protein)
LQKAELFIVVDIVDIKTRSRMMSRIRGRDTRPELVLRKILHRNGFRYRTHVSTLPGRPDLVFAKYGAVIFVHGCFWHRHSGCRFATTPSTNIEFWKNKFEGNIKRDAATIVKLKVAGWRVAVVWECVLERDAEKAAVRIERWLTGRRRELLLE